MAHYVVRSWAHAVLGRFIQRRNRVVPSPPEVASIPDSAVSGAGVVAKSKWHSNSSTGRHGHADADAYRTRRRLHSFVQQLYVVVSDARDRRHLIVSRALDLPPAGESVYQDKKHKYYCTQR